MRLSDNLLKLSAESMSLSSPSLFWAREPDDELLRSIGEHGQLQPVLAEGGESPVLLAGYKRVKALAALGLPVLVRCVEGELGDFEKGLLYLADNGTRALDEGLRVAALRYFSRVADGKIPVDELVLMLGLKTGSGELRQYLNWLKLPLSFDAHLEAGRIPLAAVRILECFDAQGLAAVEPFFRELKWSRSNALIFLTMAYETARARSVGVREFLETEAFAGILDQDLSPKDRIAALTALARKLRLPVLAELERSFGDDGARLVAGTPWKVAHGINFEAGAVDLTIQIRNKEQLEKAVQTLREISGSELWERLWSVGGDDR